jgi:O-antigen ligase
MIGLSTIVVIVTQSRGGLIAFIVLAMTVFLAFPSGPSRRRAVVSIGVAGCVLLALAPKDAWTRLAGLSKMSVDQGMQGVDVEGSAQDRWAIATTAVRVFADHPVGGTGAGTYMMMNARYSPRVGPKDAHSTYLRILAEEGAVGLVLFLGMIASLFGLVRTRARQLAPFSAVHALSIKIGAAGILAYLVAGLWSSLDRVAFLHLSMLIVFLTAQRIGTERVPLLRER